MLLSWGYGLLCKFGHASLNCGIWWCFEILRRDMMFGHVVGAMIVSIGVFGLWGTKMDVPLKGPPVLVLSWYPRPGQLRRPAQVASIGDTAGLMILGLLGQACVSCYGQVRWGWLANGIQHGSISQRVLFIQMYKLPHPGCMMMFDEQLASVHHFREYANCCQGPFRWRWWAHSMWFDR